MLPELNPIELIFLAAFALIVIGPKELPGVLRKIGQWTAKMRGLAAEFRASFDEMARQSELDELRKEVEALRTGQFLGDAKSSLESSVGEINDHLSHNYWDAASSHADPVQMFSDVAAAEGDEVAALPPPGSHTPPLPTRTRKAPASKEAPKPKAATKASTRKPSAKPVSEAAAPTVATRAPHAKIGNAARAIAPASKAEAVVTEKATPAKKPLSAKAASAPKTSAVAKTPAVKKPASNKPAPEAAEI